MASVKNLLYNAVASSPQNGRLDRIDKIYKIKSKKKEEQNLVEAERCLRSTSVDGGENGDVTFFVKLAELSRNDYLEKDNVPIFSGLIRGIRVY